MKSVVKTLLLSASAMVGANAAMAEGQLQLYNWGDYTSPELIQKFEETYDVDVTLTDYDNNATALAKIKAGGHGFDLVVPSANYIPIFIEEGLLVEAHPEEMENFKNIDPRWVDVEFDPGRRYTVPWLWGTIGMVVNTDTYGGDINTSAIFLDPPAELEGKINVVPEMGDVMALAYLYAGGKPCETDKEILKKARDLLVEAKPKWASMAGGVLEKITAGDIQASVNWNGSSYRAHLENPAIDYGYPEEGYIVWMDNVAMLKDGPNPENAKLFMNFIMDPENAALMSNYAKYPNAVMGSTEFMDPDLATAPQVVPPEEFADNGYFNLTCDAEAQKYMTAIWTELNK